MFRNFLENQDPFSEDPFVIPGYGKQKNFYYVLYWANTRWRKFQGAKYDPVGRVTETVMESLKSHTIVAVLRLLEKKKYVPLLGNIYYNVPTEEARKFKYNPYRYRSLGEGRYALIFQDCQSFQQATQLPVTCDITVDELQDIVAGDQGQPFNKI